MNKLIIAEIKKKNAEKANAEGRKKIPAIKKYKPINRSPGLFYVKGMLIMFNFFRLFSYFLTHNFILKKYINERYKGDIIKKEDRVTSIIIKLLLLDRILFFLGIYVFKKKFKINNFDTTDLEEEYFNLPELKHYNND